MPGKITILERTYFGLVSDVIDLLRQARPQSARSINAIMTATYRDIDQRIVKREQQGKALAGYGEARVERLSADLTSRFGKGFSQPNFKQMRQFYLACPNPQTLSDQSTGD